MTGRNSKKTRAVWEAAYGPIPRDEQGRSYEIHHIDRNPGNDSLTNLECLSIQEHYNVHLQAGEYLAANLIAQRMDGSVTTGWTHSEETRKKIGKNSGAARKGKQLSEEHRKAIQQGLNSSQVFKESLKSKERCEKISKSLKGRTLTEDHRQALSRAQKERFANSPGPRQGIIPSEETRKKISEAGKGRTPWNKGSKLSEEHRAKLSEAAKSRKLKNKLES